MRSCRLNTTSRDDQVHPEVFEMFNTIGSIVPLSAPEYSSHQLCLCVPVRTHGDLTYYPGNHLQSYFLSRLLWVNPVNALWCVALYTLYGWMCMSVVRCFLLCICFGNCAYTRLNSFCLQVNTLGIATTSFCVVLYATLEYVTFANINIALCNILFWLTSIPILKMRISI